MVFANRCGNHGRRISRYLALQILCRTWIMTTTTKTLSTFETRTAITVHRGVNMLFFSRTIHSCCWQPWRRKKKFFSITEFFFIFLKYNIIFFIFFANKKDSLWSSYIFNLFFFENNFTRSMRILQQITPNTTWDSNNFYYSSRNYMKIIRMVFCLGIILSSKIPIKIFLKRYNKIKNTIRF